MPRKPLVCGDEDMPDKRTILRWLTESEHAQFCPQSARARERQGDALFDEALAIADAAEDDLITDDDGNTRLNHEHVQRSRLRV